MKTKKTNKSWSVAIVSLTALLFSCVVLFTAVSGNNTTSTDPLVSLSYLNDIFKAEFLQGVNQSISEQMSGLEREIAQDVNGIVNSINGSGSVTIHARAYVTAGTQYLVLSNADFLVLSGTIKANGAGLLDTTTGKMVEPGQILEENHLYIATSALSLAAETETVLLIRE